MKGTFSGNVMNTSVRPVIKNTRSWDYTGWWGNADTGGMPKTQTLFIQGTQLWQADEKGFAQAGQYTKQNILKQFDVGRIDSLRGGLGRYADQQVR